MRAFDFGEFKANSYSNSGNALSTVKSGYSSIESSLSVCFDNLALFGLEAFANELKSCPNGLCSNCPLLSAVLFDCSFPRLWLGSVVPLENNVRFLARLSSIQELG